MPDLNSLRKAVQKAPTDVPLRLLLGQGLLDANSLQEADECYRGVLNIDPLQKDAQLGIAQILFHRGSVSEAAVRAEAILEADDEFARAHLLLSRLHLVENNRSLAVEEYRLAIDNDRTIADRSLEKELGLAAPSGAVTYDEDGVPDFLSDTGPFAETEQNDDISSFENDDEVLAESVDPAVSFRDVGGLDDVKDELLRRWIRPLKNPSLAHAYKVKPGGGVLLYGPPGCGKSLLAEATAGESGCRMIQVGIHEILDPYFGSSERNLFQVLETAREEAPIVVILDHIDTVAGDRSRLRDNQARNLVNQFLHQLHMLSQAGDRVLVVGCTDTPWHLDPAFLRPGRFGQPLFVPPPSRNERVAILQLLTASMPTGEIDVELLATGTRSFSGADLRAIFDLAAEQALQAATLGGQFQPLDTAALLTARKSIRPSTTAWFRSAQKNIPRIQDDEAFAAVREAVTNNRKA